MVKKELRSKNPNTIDLLTGAIVLNNIPIVKKLLSHSDVIDVNAKDSHNNLPIFVCVNLGRIECLRLLLQHNANPDITDNLGRSPLIYALRKDYIKNRYLIVKELCKHCDVNFVSNQGTAMFIAKSLRRPIYLTLLKKYGAKC
jgi:ankyrin repeat protein